MVQSEMFQRCLSLTRNYDEDYVFKKTVKLCLYGLYSRAAWKPQQQGHVMTKSTYLYVDILLCVNDMNK